MNVGRLLAAGLLAAGCSPPPKGPAEARSRASSQPRIVVEVLNASAHRGLARVGTRTLRRQGLDVVDYGTADTTLDSTLVLVRRGRVNVGEPVRRALGAGKIRVALDTLRRVDVTVLLGRDWMPPADGRP